MGVSPNLSVQASGNVFRVKPAGMDSGACGDTWENACSLQHALGLAGTGDEIWVAEGTYKPTTGTDRTISFVLKDSVAIFGGFAGTELDRSQRDPAVNVTILSGDIGSVGAISDNSYHVIRADQSGASTLLDGVTISGGNANGTNPYDRGGGAYSNSSSASLVNITLSNNFASFLGGGMFTSNGNLKLTHVTFADNSSTNHGGGIYNYYGTLTLTDVTFSGNSAQLRGGGLYNYSGSATLSNVTFTGNSAQELGGGMNNYQSNVTVSNVTFTNNSAVTSGGGIYTGGGSLSLTTGTFAGNSAKGGAGMLNSSDSIVTLAHVTFNGNSAQECGGGVYNYLSDANLTDVTFTGNTAQQHGGGIFNSGSSPTLSNVIFDGNTSGIYGGAMDNSGGTPALSGVTFTNNAAGYGGAIYNWDYSSPSLTDVTFNNNSASFRGGGIYSIYADNMTLTNVTFTGNTSQTEGAGMFTSDSNPTLNRVNFFANTTPSYGGGMYNSYTHATLTDVTFSGNTAANGGGLNNNNSDPILTNVTFSGNSAQVRGGGLYNYASDPTLANVTFTNNVAVQEYGGGIFNSGGTLNLENATLSNNTAGIYGGGISIDGTITTIDNSIFWGNVAGTNGSQIYSFHPGMPAISDSVVENGCPAGGVCTSVIAADPLLGALGDYGGFTQTIPLLEGSSAIDTGNDATCPSTDQRGVTRPQGPHCDIGAYEVNVFALTSLDPSAMIKGSAEFSLKVNGTSLSAGDIVYWNGEARPTTFVSPTQLTAQILAADVDSVTSAEVTVKNPDLVESNALTFSTYSFADVLPTSWSYRYVEGLYAQGITSGCAVSPFRYCPDSEVTRAQMAVFLLKAKFGSDYLPPAASGTLFGDVPVGYWAGAWIEQLADEGITSGCSAGMYCPQNPVTRAQMAIFLLKAEHGSAYVPPPASGVFSDVPADYWAAAWIEQLAAEGITTGCSTNPLNYCPARSVTRAQMAVFIDKAFGFALLP